MSVQSDVTEFHRAFGLPVRPSPTTDLSDEEVVLRVELLSEEFGEYDLAADRKDLVKIADGLADVVYVAYGTALVYGLDLDAVLAEVHRSNMTKLGADGKPVFRSDGKVLKGPDYSEPDIAGVLKRTEIEALKKRIAELEGEVGAGPIRAGDRVRVLPDPKYVDPEGDLRDSTLAPGREGMVQEPSLSRLLETNNGPRNFALDDWLIAETSLERI